MAITRSAPKSSLEVFGFRWAQSLQGFTTSVCKYHPVALLVPSGSFLNCGNSPCKLATLQRGNGKGNRACRYLCGNRNRIRNRNRRRRKKDRYIFVPRRSEGQQQVWEKPVLSTLCAFLKLWCECCPWPVVHLPLLTPFTCTALHRSCPQRGMNGGILAFGRK